MARPKATSFLVGILLFILSVIFVNLRYNYTKQQHELEMSTLLNSVHKNLEQTLKSTYNSNLAIAMTINDQGQAEDFDKVAADVSRLNPIIDIIELVPNGVIKYIYPLEPNVSVLNYNIFEKPEVAYEAQQAIEKKSVYFAGPFELKQGGLAVAGRYPVYIKDKFWGFSAVLIRFENLIEASGVYANNNPDFHFQFSKVNPKTKKEVFFLNEPTDFKDRIYKKVFLSDGDWNLYVIDKKNANYYFHDLFIYALICLLACLILPYFIYIILKKPQELEVLNTLQAQKILNSEAKFQAIFNKTSIAIAQIKNESQTFIEVNLQFCTLVARSPEKLIDTTFTTLIHPEDTVVFKDYLQTIKNTPTENKSITLRIENHQKEYIWVRIVASPLMEETKNSHTTILAIEDISLRKIAEEKLIQSEIQYKSLFQESPIALWEEDGSEVKLYFEQLGLMYKSGDYVRQFLKENKLVLFDIISKIKVININHECLKLYKATTKKELIHNFKESMKHSPTDAIIEMLVDISQGAKKGRTEAKTIFPDGRKLVLALTWNIVAGYEDTFGRFIISAEDITTQVMAQKLIVASEQKMQSLINSIDGIVWECDAKTYLFNFVSAQAKTILGYEIDEWLNDPQFWSDKIHPEDREWVVNFCKENVKIRNHFSFEYRMIAKNGTIVWLRDIVNVDRQDYDTTLLKGIMIDITLIKENESALNRSLEMVTEQNKRLLNFSYIVSHNLRSHTSNIQSLSILIKESDDLDEQHQLIQLIGTVSNDLNETISNLNEVINIQNNVNLNVQPLNLLDYVLKTLDILSEDIRKKDIKILGTIPPDTTIEYNRAYLQSILINVISNAVRYSKTSYENRFIKFNFYTEKSFSILEIEDNGIGINMLRHKDKVFGLYKTFSNNKDAKGIGLFITKNQIEAMGGKIEIESQLNKGTLIRIFFKN